MPHTDLSSTGAEEEDGFFVDDELEGAAQTQESRSAAEGVHDSGMDDQVLSLNPPCCELWQACI